MRTGRMGALLAMLAGHLGPTTAARPLAPDPSARHYSGHSGRVRFGGGGSGYTKPTFDRAHQNRRNKLAKLSRRRNRGTRR